MYGRGFDSRQLHKVNPTQQSGFFIAIPKVLVYSNYVEHLLKSHRQSYTENVGN